MKVQPGPVMDTRSAVELLDLLLDRRAGFVPEWEPAPRSAGHGFAHIAARQVEIIIERLNRVPEKQKLAFLDLLGIGLIPAQGARAPLVFTLNEKAASGSAPAGTPVAAPPPPGGTQPIVFETDRPAGIRAGKLAQVVSLWPGRDQYIDHSAAFTSGQPVRCFARPLLGPTPHYLYLAHSVLLALSGPVELGVEFELVQQSSSPLDMLWEYWDGKVWRGFLSTLRECQQTAGPPLDGTNGFTSSGTATLRAECAKAATTKVNGFENYWIRARLDEPLPADPDRQLPEVERIRISSSVNRGLRGRLAVEVQSQGFVVLAQAFSVMSIPMSVPSPNLSIGGRVVNSAGQAVKGATVILAAGVSLQSPSVVMKAQVDDQGGFTMPAISIDSAEQVGFRVLAAGLEFAGPSGPVAVPPASLAASSLSLNLVIGIDGLAPDKAFSDGVTLDLSKPFYPLGQQPQPGATFYVTSEEVFSKPGAKARAYCARTRSPQDEANVSDNGVEAGVKIDHQTVWEYWNGRNWTPLAVTANVQGSNPDLDVTEFIDFTVPADMVAVKVNDEEARWIRVRLQSGSYGFRREVTFQSGTDPKVLNKFTLVVARPPVLAEIKLGYTWQFGPFFPESALTYNDFRFEDHTFEATWPGTVFQPFRPVSDTTPTLYLGFDKQPPVDSLGIYLDIQERAEELSGPPLAWQYWNGAAWRDLNVEDETGYLRRAGMVTLLAQPDDSALARFGTPLYWFRARLKEDGPPGEPVVQGIFPNAAWATQRQTLRDVNAGTSNGSALQAMTIPQTPVLPGEILEVRELSGARAAVEWRTLALELFGGDPAMLKQLEAGAQRERLGADLILSPLRLRRDRRNRIAEAWVLWQYRDSLDLSAAGDRHYTLDRATGKLAFGDGVNGRIPPTDGAVVLRRMVTGGGLQGNVAAGAISQLLGVVPGLESVTNPREAEGGANTEEPSSVIQRGPETVRHRGRAISADGYEAMAREASPAVAVARAIPGRHPSGARTPGWVTLVIVPHGDERRPFPSFGLREAVRQYLEARCDACLAAAHRIHVIGPSYFALDIAATLAPIVPADAGVVERRAVAALERFLHPLYGGPDGDGWALGRDVYTSDVAAVLERIEGLDYVQEITLLKDSVPQGDRVEIPDEYIVVTGAIQLSVQASER